MKQKLLFFSFIAFSLCHAYGQNSLELNQAKKSTDSGWILEADIDVTKDYRFTVWIKSNAPLPHTTFFGCSGTSIGAIEALNPNVVGVPYFFADQLPMTEKWYLLVGYVHRNTHQNTTSQGGLYDPATGEKVVSLTDFKFGNTPETTLRGFLYSDASNQFFDTPQLEIVDENTPALASRFAEKQIRSFSFTYDEAGNQTIRKAPDDTVDKPAVDQQMPEGIIAIPDKAETDEAEDADDVADISQGESPDEEASEDPHAEASKASVQTYPNPTTGVLTISLPESNTSNIAEIIVSEMSGKGMPTPYTQQEQNAQIDLSNYPKGIYFVTLLLENGARIQKKIIKR